MCALGTADGQVAAERGKDRLVDGEVDRKGVGGECVVGALVEVVQPVEV
jgi:hypothetical protein